ncbi:hypothetical protein PG999_001687 [Apiospora kogelbergensis]|uniref:Uncharacterized protein n=1 Tax=Apiospora kogelbergensis TaxID=1337665 RepID=A0AAW0R603_9PEZI
MKAAPLNRNTADDWEDVAIVLKSSCDNIQQTSSRNNTSINNIAKRLRTSFDSLCKHAGAGETFVSLIPNDQFGFASVLCGGLKTVFLAMKNTHEHREQVYKAIEDLPYIICDNAVSLEDVIEDEDLHKRAAALHVAVFKVIRRILRWSISGSFVTALKFVANPQRPLSELREDLAEVKVKANRFQQRALIISQSHQRESLRLHCLSAQAEEGRDAVIQTMQRDIQGLSAKISRLCQLEWIYMRSQGAATATYETKSLPRRRQPKLLLEPEVYTILEKLKYERGLVSQDCEVFQRSGRQSNLTMDLGRMFAIESTFRIQAWLTIDESSMLLVNGRSESRRSPELSILSARIIDRLLESHRTGEPSRNGMVIVPLAFFCSQHRDRKRDPYSNPSELAMSLLLQLIEQHHEGIKSSLIRECHAQLEPTSMISICYWLRKMIADLSEKVVLLVILDGLVFFTQSTEQSEETKLLISSLVSIFRGRRKATLKFMFSSPVRLDFIEDLFLDSELLDLPRSIATNQLIDKLEKKSL